MKIGSTIYSVDTYGITDIEPDTVIPFIYDGSKWYMLYAGAKTYASLAAEEDGTDESLVTTGEKYIWNNKVNRSGDVMTGNLTLNKLSGTNNITYGTTLPSSPTNGQIFLQLSDPYYELPPGGTTGQVLTKSSNTDRDVVWTDVQAADSGVTALDAGTGLITNLTDNGTITGVGIIKTNLNSETPLGTLGTTNRLYAVGVDANGKLCVNVPWVGSTIQDNLTSSTNTTDALSAKQGYLLANGSARDSTKLPLAGGEMSGSITVKSTSAIDLGSSSKAWNNIYANTFNGAMSHYIDIGGKQYNGSADITIYASDLGVSSALNFAGIISETLPNMHDAGYPSTSDVHLYSNGNLVSKSSGTVVICHDTQDEFLWSEDASGNAAWYSLGLASSFALHNHTHGNILNNGAMAGTISVNNVNTSSANKAIVTDSNSNITIEDLTVSDPSVIDNANTTSFISSISQSSTGKITAVKSNISDVYVKKSGDTMTGNLYMGTTNQVNGRHLVFNGKNSDGTATRTLWMGYANDNNVWYFWDSTNSAPIIVSNNSGLGGTRFAGNADTATTLATARNINGTSFDGSANITTAKWGTARNISIADSDSTNTGTAVSVNGSANVTLKLPATIKATLSGNASSATKATQDGAGNVITSTYVKKAGDTMSDNLTIQKATGDTGVIINNTNKNHEGSFIIGGDSGNLGIWDISNSKWVVYSTASGSVTLNGNANTATTATSATYLKDKTNNTATYSNYGAAGLAASNISWMTCWNGYELRAISKAETFNAVRDNGGDSRWVKKAGDTIDASGQLSRTGKGVSWYQGRSNALIRITSAPSASGWNPITSCKTTNGDWSTGTLGDTYYFVYTKDTNFNAGTNTTANGVRITASSQLYGAVWNDYAEYRKDNMKEKDIQIPGKCVREVGDGTLALTTKRLERGCEIISDTFGFAIGQDEENGYNTPIASNGRVLAYPYESIEEFASHIGYPVCSGPDGTVSIMTDEEEEKYPSRIIGTISEIPNYEEWGSGKVKVNGRVWIRIK